MLVSTTTIDARKVCGSNAASLDANGVNYEAIVACARYNNASTKWHHTQPACKKVPAVIDGNSLSYAYKESCSYAYSNFKRIRAPTPHACRGRLPASQFMRCRNAATPKGSTRLILIRQSSMAAA